MINELYDGISDQVLEKYNASDIAHQRAEDLLRRASNLATALTTSNKSLQSKSFIFIYCVKNAWILINALKYVQIKLTAQIRCPYLSAGSTWEDKCQIHIS